MAPRGTSPFDYLINTFEDAYTIQEHSTIQVIKWMGITSKSVRNHVKLVENPEFRHDSLENSLRGHTIYRILGEIL